MGSLVPRRFSIQMRGAAFSRLSRPSNPIRPAWSKALARIGGSIAAPSNLMRHAGERIRLSTPSVNCFRRINIKLDQIVAIDVEMSRFQFGMCGGKTIASRAQAQMSLPYAIAAKLQFGKVGPAEIKSTAWTSPQITEWLGRISVHIDDRMADEDEPAVSRDAIRRSPIHCDNSISLWQPRKPLAG